MARSVSVLDNGDLFQLVLQISDFGASKEDRII